MRHSLATMSRALYLLAIIALLIALVTAAPTIHAEAISPSSKTIAPVQDTGDFADLLDSAADTAPPIPSRIPTKDETATQLNVYKTQPLTLAHGVENILDRFGLGAQTNVILDSLCLLAYAYLLRLTSRSSKYIMELTQFLGFFLFPALPFIQCANNAFRTLSNTLHDGSSGIRHTLSCLTGHYATTFTTLPSPLSPIGEKPKPDNILYTDDLPKIPTITLIRQRLTHIPTHELESPTFNHLHSLRRLGGFLLAAVTIVASITTLHIHLDHPVRSDWDSVGIASDQRHGWLSASATLSSFLSVLALITNSSWSIKPDFARPETRTGVLGETEVFAELALAAVVQDLFAGFSGADSFAGYVASATANKWGLLVLVCVLGIMNKRLVCVAQYLFSSGRAKGRRGSGQVSRPAVVVGCLIVMACVGGYHVLGPLMAVRVRGMGGSVSAMGAVVGTSSGSGSGSLSDALSGPG